MLPSLTAWDYVSLGRMVAALRNPRNARLDDYQAAITGLLDGLGTCDFAATRAAAEGLNPTAILHKDGLIVDSVAQQLAALVGALQRALEHESKARQVIVLNTGGVSAKLRSLPSRVALNDTQRHLLEETVRCLECAAYRAAAIMAWNLAYDWIRRWMWDDAARRASFNTKVMAKMRGGAPVYPVGLTTYEDFYNIQPAIGERDVLEFMRDAGLLPRVYEKLASYLKERNNYAHANDIVPSIYQSNMYIEQLVDIISNAPFI